MERIPLRMGVLNLLHELLHAFGAGHDPKGKSKENHKYNLHNLMYILWKSVYI